VVASVRVARQECLTSQKKIRSSSSSDHPLPSLFLPHVCSQVEIVGRDLAARDVTLLNGRSSDPYLVLLQNGVKLAQTEVRMRR